MPIVSLDSLKFSGVVWTFKLLPTDQHMVLKNDKANQSDCSWYTMQTSGNFFLMYGLVTMNSLQAGCFVSMAQSSPQFKSTHFYIHLLFQVYHGCLPPFCYQRNVSKASINSTVGGGLQESIWAQYKEAKVMIS